MKVNLEQLLNERHVVLPNSIVQINTPDSCSFSMDLKSAPWWKNEATSYLETITISFLGIQTGCFDFELLDKNDDRILENLQVQRSKNISWAAEFGDQIFCSSSIPLPLNIYAAVHDFIQETECFYSAAHFLNMGCSGKLSEFTAITSTTTFLLGIFPTNLSLKICDILDQQCIKYSKVTMRFQRHPSLFVSLGSSAFFCETAYAEFV